MPRISDSGQTVVIEGEPVPVQYRDISLTKVKLDASNPRIQHAIKKISSNGNISPTELRNLILEQPGVPELFRSIRDNGGINEPIYVRPDGRIIEGNCRAATYLRLHEIKPKDPRWQTIPAAFIPEITDRQVAVLQGQHHVAGKNKWEAYEKAGHIHSMHTKLGMDEKAIARALGIREGEVIKSLESYKVMTEKVLPKLKGRDGLQKWSFVHEFFKSRELEDYRSKPSNVDAFVKLVVDKKIKKGADVRKLGKIVKHPTAFKVLKKHDVDTAMTSVGKVDPTADSKAFRTLKKATTVLRRFSQLELQRLREHRKSRQILEELFTAITEVAKAAEIKL